MRTTKRVSTVLAIAAALALTGCAWSSAAGIATLVLGLLALAIGCGGQAISNESSTGDAGTDDDSATAPDTGLDTGTDTGTPDSATVKPDAGSDAAPDAPPIGCGGGYCPTGMTCTNLGNGPWCLPNADMDELLDDADNCPHASNSEQLDGDGDGVGDTCDLCDGPNDAISCGLECCNDPDGDKVPGQDVYGGWNGMDNCPYVPNPDQLDSDEDGIGDACDLCPEEFNPLSPCGDPCLDSDGDGVSDMGYCGDGDVDWCPYAPSEHMDDVDGDQVGDVCDPDGIAPLTRRMTVEGLRLAMLARLGRSGVLDPETVRIAGRA